jgi:hypothetical protein
MEDEKVMSGEQLQEILTEISFAPNCVDMKWDWSVVDVRSADPGFTRDPGDGWLIATTFQRPDRGNGEISRGQGRKWFVARGTTESGVVKTCFAACKMILEHEIMEAFLYKEKRVFDPHNTVAELAALQDGKRG